MRIFKNKWFNHWAGKEKISDDTLIEAAKEIEAGKIEANLGGFLFKKRLSINPVPAKVEDTGFLLDIEKEAKLFFYMLLQKIRGPIFLKKKKRL